MNTDTTAPAGAITPTEYRQVFGLYREPIIF